MTSQLPVGWDHDFDLYDPTYLEDPTAVWRAMRERCPVAQTERRGGAMLPVRHDDITTIARNPQTFSSRVLESTGHIPSEGRELRMPPITSDPPDHGMERTALLPLFNRAAVNALEAGARRKAAALVDQIAGMHTVDAADAFARPIPMAVIVEMLGLPPSDADQFSGWIVQLLKEGQIDQDVRKAAINTIRRYFFGYVRGGREVGAPGVITHLLGLRSAGDLDDEQVVGMCFLLLIAGIDTTWCTLGSCLWHLATHEEDRRRLAADYALIPNAVEEFIRAYAPITIARVVTEATEVAGCPVAPGDRVLLPWGAANRDPGVFEDPDRVLIDRERNPHLAFGLGIHRCLGSGLARMEIRVAIEEWLRRIPEFALDPDRPVRWTGGNVRGPESLYLRLDGSSDAGALR
jgi:hypothetical protein